MAKRAGSPDPDQDGGAGHRRLLHQLERQPAAHAQDPFPQRQHPVEQGPADDLVHRVVAPDVLAGEQQLPGGVEQPGGVQTPRPLERRLLQAGRKLDDQVAGQRRAVGQRGAVDGHLLERALAAHPARRGGVEAPGSGVAGQRARDLDDVGGQVLGQPGLAHAVDQPLAVQKAECELLILARGSHRHRQRLAVHADLKRVLDRHLVADAVVNEGLVHRLQP